MRKIALIEPGKLELQKLDKETELQKGTVKVDVSACAICGSDLALLSGKGI